MTFHVREAAAPQLTLRSDQTATGVVRQGNAQKVAASIILAAVGPCDKDVNTIADLHRQLMLRVSEALRQYPSLNSTVCVCHDSL